MKVASNSGPLTELAVTRGQIMVLEIDDSNISDTLRVPTLDRGERHVLDWAIKEKAELVLLDDRLARRTGQQLGLRVKGTLGVLLDAFLVKLISKDEMYFYLDRIQRDDDIWIDSELVNRIRQEIEKSAEHNS